MPKAECRREYRDPYHSSSLPKHFQDVGVSENQGYLVGPYNKDSCLSGSVWGSPTYGYCRVNFCTHQTSETHQVRDASECLSLARNGMATVCHNTLNFQGYLSLTIFAIHWEMDAAEMPSKLIPCNGNRKGGLKRIHVS